MLSEKQAIDILQNQIADYVIGNYCAKCGDFSICENKDEDCYYIQSIDTVLNLITNLQKENEELLEVKISVSAENTIQNLKRENIKLEERCFIAEGNLKTTKEELRDYFYNSIPKQKIKDKIEELKGKLNTDNTIRLYTLKDSYELQITILNELLEEKEGENKGNGN